MTERYWFKRRRYGYGFTPATTAGWLVFAAVMVVTVGGGIVLSVIEPTGPGPVVWYLVAVAVAVAGLLVLSYRKGPKPRWRSGWKPGDDPAEDA